MKMMNIPGKSKQIYLIFALGFLLASCSQHKKVDVSNIDVTVKIDRFDHDFDDMSRKPMMQQALFMHKKYGAFYTDFIERILQAGSINDTAYFATLRKVFASQAYKDLKHAVDSVYPNVDKQSDEVTDVFRRIKYYFPHKTLPQVHAYFSGFQAQTMVGDGYFGIGLDEFLGANSKFYPALIDAYPHYISRRFTPENMAPRVAEGMVREDMFPETDKDKTLLSKMIYNGKILYAMDLLVPDAADSTKIGYTTAQLKWCENFKAQIWGYFLGENLLYEVDDQKIGKYMSEAPFTPGLGEKNESAPKLAVWTGWQIVRQYMEKHPDVTLEQLMADEDAQQILNASKYRPKAEN